MKPTFTIERLLIDQEVLELEATKEIESHVKKLFGHSVETTIIDSSDQEKELLKTIYWQKDSFAAGKRTLYLTKGQGKRVHACPGTQKAYCCNLYVVDLVENCPFDCSYCYLQGHLTSPLLRVHVNVEDYLNDIDTLLKASPEKEFRIGSGELADSLALDPITKQAAKLVRFFAKQKNAQLELKTKSACVEELLRVDPNGNTVIGWSINPREIVDSEEHHTASLDERFAAAESVMQAGYQVAFHFDPIIHVPGWSHKYAELLNELQRRFNQQSIAWISLGTLRFPKGLRSVAMRRHPKSLLPLGEFIEGVDKKERYLPIKRVNTYERMLRLIRESLPKTPTYLCMENPAIWQKIFDGTPRSDPRLKGIYG